MIARVWLVSADVTGQQERFDAQYNGLLLTPSQYDIHDIHIDRSDTMEATAEAVWAKIELWLGGRQFRGMMVGDLVEISERFFRVEVAGFAEVDFDISECVEVPCVIGKLDERFSA